MPDKVESDQHVASYRWLLDDVDRRHPPYYFLTYCPSCFYTDSAEEFAKPGTNPLNLVTIKSFRKSHATNVLIPLLGKHVHQDNVDYESALNLHYLAIAICLLGEEDSQDFLKLARLYLRLAWLYREGDILEGGGVSGGQDAASQKEESASETVPRLLAAVQAMTADVQGLQDKWAAVQPLLRQRIREVARLGTNPYPSCFAALSEAFEKQKAMTAQLKDMCVRDANGILFPSLKKEEPQNPQAVLRPVTSRHGSYEAFFGKIKELWPDAPSNETDAIKLAVATFRHALGADPRLSELQNYLTIANLLVDLMQRLNDTRGAFEMARTIYMTAVNERQTLQNKLREGGISGEEIRRMEATMKRAAQATEEAAELRRKLTEEVIENEWPAIKAAIQKYGPDEDAIENALSEQGFVQEVTKELRKSGRLKSL